MKIVFKDFIYLNDNEKINILELRNQDFVRANMVNSEPISLKNHLSFIEDLKKYKNKRYFAISKEDEILGSLNFIKRDEISWGLYFKDEMSPVLKACITYIFLDYIFLKFDENINSFVKKENKQALSFNKNFGFEVFKEDDKYIYLKLSKKIWTNQKNTKLIKPVKRYLDKIEYYFKD